MINISPNEFIINVNAFSNNKLFNTEDIKSIYGKAVKNSKVKIFEDLAFSAKYVRGLMRALKEGSSNPEVKNIDLIKSDISANIEKIKDMAQQIYSGDKDEYSRIENKYFELTTESFSSLNYLLSDLEWVKMYINESKRKKR